MIIGEIGQNWCADIELAKKLIRLAKENGADLAKFQLYDSKELYGEYQNTELTKAQAFDFFEYGRDIGIEVFFSVFDVERVKWCEEMGVRRFKVACSAKKDKRLMGYLYGTEMPIIVSLEYPERGVYPDRGNYHYLFCVSKYPAEVSDYLKYASPAYRCYYEGISDHTIGIDAAKIALARGAQIIEKHFAISHDKGVDAEWSMTPDELRELKRFETVCKEAL